MSAVAGLERGFLLPSRADRAAKRGQLVVTEYRYRVEVGSVLAGCLEVGKRYSVGVGERDLGVHCWISGDRASPSDDYDDVDTETARTLTVEKTGLETCNFVSNAHGGFAVFRVVESLTMPPALETRMHLLLLPDSPLQKPTINPAPAAARKPNPANSPCA